MFSHQLIATMQSVVTGQAPTNNSGAEDYLRRKNNQKQKPLLTITNYSGVVKLMVKSGER